MESRLMTALKPCTQHLRCTGSPTVPPRQQAHLSPDSLSELQAKKLGFSSSSDIRTEQAQYRAGAERDSPSTSTKACWSGPEHLLSLSSPSIFMSSTTWPHSKPNLQHHHLPSLKRTKPFLIRAASRRVSTLHRE